MWEKAMHTSVYHRILVVGLLYIAWKEAPLAAAHSLANKLKSHFFRIFCVLRDEYY